MAGYATLPATNSKYWVHINVSCENSVLFIFAFNRHILSIAFPVRPCYNNGSRKENGSHMHAQYGNTLDCTPLGYEYIKNPSAHKDIELTVLESKIIVLVATHDACNILTLYDLIKSNDIGVSTPFLDHNVLIRLVAGLVKYKYLSYNKVSEDGTKTRK